MPCNGKDLHALLKKYMCIFFFKSYIGLPGLTHLRVKLLLIPRSMCSNIRVRNILVCNALLARYSKSNFGFWESTLKNENEIGSFLPNS